MLLNRVEMVMKYIGVVSLILGFFVQPVAARWTPIDNYQGRHSSVIQDSNKTSGFLQFQVGRGAVNCNQKVVSAELGFINTNYHCCAAGGGNITAGYNVGVPGSRPSAVRCQRVPGGAKKSLDTCLLECPGLPELAKQGAVKSMNFLTRRPKAGELIYSATNNCGPGQRCRDSRRLALGRAGNYTWENVEIGGDDDPMTVRELMPTSVYTCQGSSGGPIQTLDSPQEAGGMICLLNSVMPSRKGSSCGNAGCIPSDRIVNWIKNSHPRIYAGMTINGQGPKMYSPIPAPTVAQRSEPRAPAAAACSSNSCALSNQRDLQQLASSLPTRQSGSQSSQKVSEMEVVVQ